MVEISNWNVYDLKESVITCRNAMRLSPPEYSIEEFDNSLKRAIALANSADGSGHQNFLKGIRVSFDIRYPNYFSPELQRYNFMDIVTSSSKMHKLLKMNLKSSCNEYVDLEAIEIVQRWINYYNELESTRFPDDPEEKQNALYKAWMHIVSNCPMGLELFMRCSTNYLQLKTIYRQRKKHKLKEDWGAFCKWIEGLPYAKEFIIGNTE